MQNIMRYTIFSLLVLSLAQNAIAGNPYKKLELLYQKREYKKLLQEISFMERQGSKRFNHFHYKYANDPRLSNLKVKTNFRLLLLEKRPEVQKRLLDKVMKDVDLFIKADKNKTYWKVDSGFYNELKQYITEQANTDYQAGNAILTEQYIQFIARNWQDTIAIYHPFYYPKSPSLNLIRTTYSVVDSFASEPIRFKLQSTYQLTKFLTDSLPDDLLKARAIYSYLAAHVRYDYESYNSGRHLNGDLDSRNLRLRPEGILLRGILIRQIGICSDFAQVFKEMCDYAGVEAGIVHGWAKGSGWKDTDVNKPINHAWNYIIVNQTDTLLLDACWASCTKNLDFYFARNPTQFIYSHLPEDASFQLLDKPITKEDFVQLSYANTQEIKNTNSGNTKELKAQNKQVSKNNSVSATPKGITTNKVQ